MTECFDSSRMRIYDRWESLRYRLGAVLPADGLSVVFTCSRSTGSMGAVSRLSPCGK